MRARKLLVAAAACLSTLVVADDTELFVKEISTRTGFRPQILLVFDTSGSMQSNSLSAKQFFEPSVKYPNSGYFKISYDYNPVRCKTSSGASYSTSACGSLSPLHQQNLYWVKGNSDSGEPPAWSANQQYMKGRYLNCKRARDIIEEQGFFTGYLRQYKFTGNEGKWEEFPAEDTTGSVIRGNKVVVDCFADIDTNANQNPGKMRKADDSGNVNAPEGFPVDGQGDPSAPKPWDNTGSYVNNTDFGLGETVTIYSENYLKWYHNDNIANKTYTRLQLAKEAMTNVVGATPSADFGLMVFNRNNNSDNDASLDTHGGRVIAGIKQRDVNAISDLQDMIDGLSGSGNTPLCETTYEAHRYLAGLSPKYGNNERRSPPGFPKPDYSIRVGGDKSGAYLDPYKACSDDVYIILMSDGDPVRDNALNSVMSAEFPGISSASNYLASLTHWMHTNDINPNKAGDQKVSTYTVGFGTGISNSGRQLLQAAADGAGGRYFEAESATDLQTALITSIVDILSANANITSPAVATDGSDRTQVLDNLYYALFSPSKTARWAGNLKKLKLNPEGTAVVDSKTKSALSTEGGISDQAYTFWSTGSQPDGPNVDQGGAAEMLRGKSNGERKLLVNHGSALVKLDKTQLVNIAGSEASVAAHMGIDADDIDTVIEWLDGQDTEDENSDSSTQDRRTDVMGDPMHSRPVAINYGGSSADVRVLVGTNMGFVHLFKDEESAVKESWAFMPYELLDNANTLRKNASSSAKVYGMDLTAAVYKEDFDLDGEVDSGERVIAYLGMRRGGNSYYAIDITDPDNPSLLWKIDSSTPGYTELALTWSKPAIGHLRTHGAGNPVLFIGAGYDTNKDLAGIGTSDSRGRGVFAIDGLTGDLIRSFTPAASQSSNNQILGMEHSIPGEIAIVDSDADGFIDRAYAADTGGNIWRLDFPGTDKTKWAGIKLAALGGSTLTDDRRFFVRPVVSRTFFNEITKKVVGPNTSYFKRQLPADFIVIGSGNIPHPLDLDTADYEFLLQDNYIQPMDWTDTNTTIPVPITISELFQLNAAQTSFANASSDEAKLDVLAGYGGFKGCYIAHSGAGEKVMAPARVLAGFSLHTTFTPGASSGGCNPGFGESKLYLTQLCSIDSEISSFRFSTTPVYDPPPIIPPPDNPGPDTPDRPRLLFPDVTDILCEGGDCDKDNDGKPDPSDPPATGIYNKVNKHNTNRVETE